MKLFSMHSRIVAYALREFIRVYKIVFFLLILYNFSACNKVYAFVGPRGHQVWYLFYFHQFIAADETLYRNLSNLFVKIRTQYYKTFERDSKSGLRHRKGSVKFFIGHV